MFLAIFHWHNPSSDTLPLGLTQHLTEMSTRNISWGVKATSSEGWQPYHFHVQTVLKSVSLNQLEPSGPAQASTGNALHLPSNNGELVITFKLKAKENIFTRPSRCYFILHKNMTLTKVECFSQMLLSIYFRLLKQPQVLLSLQSLQPVMLLLQTVEYFQDVVGMFNGITFMPWTYETSPLVYQSQISKKSPVTTNTISRIYLLRGGYFRH